MLKRLLLLSILILLAACQPEPTPVRPTVIPFPTMTPGQTLHGVLTPAAARPATGLLSNPATVEALTNRATVTPDFTNCPVPQQGINLPTKPTTADAASAAIIDFLNAGGTAKALEDNLRYNWLAFGDTGYLNQNDLTASGAIDFILGYTTPENSGALLIIGCSDGRYVLRYQVHADGNEPPEMISIGDINRSFVNDLVFATRICEEDACEFETRMIEWSKLQGRFINLLNENLVSLNTPIVRDIDNDQVGELVLNLDSRGNSATGPLRTGVNIFDWNGGTYVLSNVQLDPPRYRIQVVQEADRKFLRQDMTNAATLYQLALDNPDLRDWFNDETRAITSYIYYRQILVYAYNGDVRLSEVLAKLNTEFATSDTVTLRDLPAFVEFAYAFVTELENSRDLHQSCVAVQKIIPDRASALQALNRYGSRSPTYSQLDLCPY